MSEKRGVTPPGGQRKKTKLIAIENNNALSRGNARQAFRDKKVKKVNDAVTTRVSLCLQGAEVALPRVGATPSALRDAR